MTAMAGILRFAGRPVGVLGLARSGLAVVRALRGVGAEPVAFDDEASAVEAAEHLGARRGEPGAIPSLAALVVSPGVPLSYPAPHPLVSAARAAQVPVTGDIELFCACLGGRRLIGVTGTNGKSTTAALIHHLLREAGEPAQLGGNIGRAVFDLELGRPAETIVLELSSYQLDLCETVRCDVAVWLNLTPDHLDRHGGLDGYVAAKKRIFRNQGPGDKAVVGQGDPISREIAATLAAVGRRVARIDGTDLVPGGVGVFQGLLIDGLDGAGRAVASLDGIASLRGAHNHENAAAAYAAVRLLGLGQEPAARGLATFPGLPHRMEEIGRIGRVAFVNDSKATNPEAAARSLDSFAAIFWIAGGKAKEGGFASLAPHLAAIRRAFLIGSAEGALAAFLDGRVPFERCGTLDVALDAAIAAASRSRDAQPVVLLAPACASFDQFRSFEHRGEAFRDLVRTRARRAEVEMEVRP
jgi:UDP-N-acetylmuramoylalanine--D-glutamate ligase